MLALFLKNVEGIEDKTHFFDLVLTLMKSFTEKDFKHFVCSAQKVLLIFWRELFALPKGHACSAALWWELQ